MYVIFVQLEPDIDHITPIAHKLAQEDSVLIVCTNILWDVRNDYRLRYLEDALGAKVAYVHQVHKGLFFKLRAMEVLLRFPERILRRLPMRIWGDFYFGVTGRIIDDKWAVSFFQAMKATCIIVDEAQPRNNLTALADAARSLGIPVVMVPTSNAVLKSFCPKPPDCSIADYSIVPHTLTLPPNETDSRLKVLGCIRYCDEWQKINSRLAREAFSDHDLPNKHGNLKVLVFGRHTKSFSENHSTMQLIYGLDYVTAVFKTKPRTVAPRRVYEVGLNNYPSARLIQWADVVICSISSIVLDILYYDKVFIYPKYIAPDEFGTFEDYNACWKVESEEELIAALKKIHRNPNFRPYTADDVNSFFRDAVYNGDRANDIFGNYAEFFRSLGASRLGKT